jgi:hypothetical protein
MKELARDMDGEESEPVSTSLLFRGDERGVGCSLDVGLVWGMRRLGCGGGGSSMVVLGRCEGREMASLAVLELRLWVAEFGVEAILLIG